MKKRFKLIFSLTAAVLLAISLSFSAFASEGEAALTAEDSTAAADSTVTEEAESVNLFEEAYRTAIRHSDELFSALAFLGTVIIAFCYKKGLIPLLTAALKSLGDNVKSLREGSVESLERAGEGVSDISERLAKLENAIELFSADVSALEESLGSEAKLRGDARAQSKILLAQIDMLKDVFISSSLPQYQKDAVNEKVKEMKEELARYEETVE